MAAVEILLIVLAGLVALVLGVFLLVYLIVPIFKGIGWVFKQLFTFIVGMVSDAARLVGALFLAVLYVPIIMGNLVIGRFSASGHYGRALTGELQAAGLCVYRICIGHPLRLVHLHGLVEGVERRLPAVVANAPTSEKPSGGRAGLFEGYSIVGSLAPGGSGAKLYVAQPDAAKLSALGRAGIEGVGQVVIKSFSLKDGSSLPQIVRESRSLDAAKKLGLILDHELSAERFYYVMRYVPGESLGLMTKRLHAGSGTGGLSDSQLRSGLGYVADLVSTLSMYHRGGLWHKDVKPDNVIVDASGRAHLVDFGLVSSLRSAMTLTTHGTEYFRDPEMVRLALKGVKVHEVDGTKFDIYGAGAVLFSVIEDSFPAHGGLSQITRRCPEAVKWIVRRAMSDYDKRYPSAAAMLADLDTVRQAADPFTVRPVDLPSMRQAFAAERGEEEMAASAAAPADGGVGPANAFGAAVGAAAGAAAAAAASAVQGFAGSFSAKVGAGRTPSPQIRVTNWWTGRCEVDGRATAPFDPAAVGAAAARAAQAAQDAARQVAYAAGVRRPASEQVAAARARVEDMRRRVRERTGARFGRGDARIGAGKQRQLNAGVFIAILVTAFAIPAILEVRNRQHERADFARVLVGPTVDMSEVTEPVVVTHPVQGNVVVVTDVMQPWSPEVSERIRSVVADLERSGLTVRGGPAPMGDEPTVSRLESAELELVASARLALGQTPIDSPEAETRLSQWLEDHAADADAIIWIAPGASAQDAPRTILVQGEVNDRDLCAALQQAVVRGPSAQ